MEFPYSLLDWENPYYPICLACGVYSHGQYRAPGDIVMGDTEDGIPTENSTVIELFLAFKDAEFWAVI